MVVSSDRASHFPAIEKKHGQPMRYWFSVMEEIKDWKYPEQIAFLKEEHGFSQGHANALVMYTKGSTSSKRFTTLAEFLKNEDPKKVKTVKEIFKVIKAKYPDLELVMAWNKPMLKQGNKYVFGVALATNHILIAPFDGKILDKMRPQLKSYVVNKKTMQVPIDWKVDSNLLYKMLDLATKSSK